jgi:malonyl-CoA/methylmalonyl-CoA synthetase
MGSLGGSFSDSCSTGADKPALTFFRKGNLETEISYLQLHRDSNRIANTLSSLGVEQGDRVLLFLPKSVVWVTAHLALQKLGAVGVPLNPRFKQSEMSYFMKDADPKLVLSGSGQEGMIETINAGVPNLVIDTEVPYQDLDFFRSASDEIDPIDVAHAAPALIVYTSGTTGRPKGAILTQRNLVHNALNIIQIWEIAASDVVCHALPLFHVHGLCFALHTALLAGAHVLMLDRFSPDTVLEMLAQRDGERACTIFMAVPSMYSRMMEAMKPGQPDFGNIRLWASGSAPLLPDVFQQIRKAFGREPVEREGMSETGMNFSNPLSGVKKPGSIGIPLPDLKVRLVDPDTALDVQPGETGEIWLKGPGVTPGYWRNAEETVKGFECGWFKTGDLGKKDEEGYYYLTDRIKDIIISGGENISPKEVERLVNQLCGVVESCVIGLDDDQWGQKAVALVVLEPGSRLTPEDIRQHCRDHLHDWKCPKEVLFLEELPKNTMGKVLKEEVKARWDRERSA